MALRNIIGHEKALAVLRGFVARNRIPHALLFSGDDGIGKKLTALNFAKALNCRSGEGGSGLFAGDAAGPKEADQGDACDECPSCNKIKSGNHPDVSIIGPEGDGGQITVSAVRAVEESLSFKPFEGVWKITIIDSADSLNLSAANAFLQTLEEPAPQSVLILVSSRPETLLPTIRSRCQQIRFAPLPVKKLSELLEAQFSELTGAESMLLSNLSGGRIGYAMNENLIEQRDRSFHVFTQLLGRGGEDAWDTRDEMEEWFDWGQLWLRDIAVYKVTGKSDLLINTDREEEIKRIAKDANTRDVLILARNLYNIRKQLRFNLNKQVTMNYTSLLLRRRLGKSRN